jgi:hypothetical protein
MQQFKQNESTAVRRYFYLHLVDASDGLTPETGEAGGQPEISKNGGAFASTSATLTAISNGAYYVALTAGEVDTLGVIMVRYKSANTAEFQDIAYVVAYDPYDSAGLGLSRLDAAVSTRAPEAGGNVAAIKAKTDNLPADPASETSVAAVPADTDTQLSSTHGAGSWEGSTPPTPAEIDAELTAKHGAGSWKKGAEFPV